MEIKNEHQAIFMKVQNHLAEYHHIPRKIPVFQDFSNQLLNCFYHSYNACVPYKDHILAQEQAQIIASIRKTIKRNNLIIRLADKSHNFYIGSLIEYEKKAEKFFSDTNAFMELTHNPFDEILNKVIQLLNHLYSKKYILKWQYQIMMPDRTKCELAHLYFNPKTHKVL